MTAATGTDTGDLAELRDFLRALEGEALPAHLAGRLDALSGRLEEVEARLAAAEAETGLAKAQFISIVSHELRLPMTSIKGYTDLILQGTVGGINPQQREFLEIVRGSVDRMSELVTDLLDLSRIETGRLKLEPAALPLAVHVEHALVELRPRIGEKGLELSVEIPADLPRVYADPVRVVQVLVRLVDNAMKLTTAGGEIRLGAAAADGYVRAEVRDTGIGIGAEDQARLFEAFYRLEDPASREQPGWGLGLHVAKSLVELMGGEIGVESERGRGSTFWFTLPVVSEN